ncbi:MAG: response regulator [Acidobacteriota bacterium]|nr:response regulator [Acidobacteriota bacterium]
MRVLIVDDSVVMRTIVERGLRQAGVEALEVRHAANGEEGLAELERADREGGGFDLILSDVHMPLMDGPELMAEARRRGLALGVPVVMITAEAQAGEGVGWGDQGFWRLMKPFTMEQMRLSLAPLLHVSANG